MSKNKIERLEVKYDKNGFSVWLDGRWIIDASTLWSAGQITIDNRNFKAHVIPEAEHHLTFRLRKRRLK